MGKQHRGVPYWVRRWKVSPQPRKSARHAPHSSLAPHGRENDPPFDRPFSAFNSRAATFPAWRPGSVYGAADSSPLQKLLAQYHPMMQPNLCVIGARPEDDAVLAGAAEHALGVTVIGDAFTCNRVLEKISALLREPHQVQRVKRIEWNSTLPLRLAGGSVDGLLFQREDAFSTFEELNGLLAEMDRVLRIGPPRQGCPPSKLAIRAQFTPGVPGNYLDTVLTSNGETYRMIVDALSAHRFAVDSLMGALEFPSSRNPAPYFTLWLTRPA